MLSAYLDGKLDETLKRPVEEHVSRCEECYFVVREVAAVWSGRDVAVQAIETTTSVADSESATGIIAGALNSAEGVRRSEHRLETVVTRLASTIPASEITPTRSPVSGRSNVHRYALPLAAALVVAVGVIVLWRIAARTRDDPRAGLVAAVGERRFFDARLTGGFKYGERVYPKRGASTHADLAISPEPSGTGSSVGRSQAQLVADDWMILAAAAAIKKDSGVAQSAEYRAALASAYLILGQADEAVRLLERTAQDYEGADDENARLLSDLAAAYLTRAQIEQRPDDLPRALESASRAVEFDASLLEAHFNKALALEELYLRNEALKEWTAYLANDPSSPWREEVVRRIARLNDRPLSLVPTDESIVTAATSGTSDELDARVRSHVGIAREVFDRHLLRVVTERPLLQRLAESLFRVTGDREPIDWLPYDAVSLEKTVRTLETAQKFRDTGAWREIESLLSRATFHVRPADLWRRMRLASALYQRRATDAEPILLSVRREIRGREYRSLDARSAVMLGLVRADNDRLGDSVDDLVSATATYRSMGDGERADDAEGTLAEILDTLGATEDAWRHRIRGLAGMRAIRRASTRYANAQSLATFSFQSGWPRVARAVLEDIRPEVQHEPRDPTALPSDRAAWFRERAVIEDHLKPGTGDALIGRAESLTQLLVDPVSRQRNEGELLVRAARITPRPGGERRRLDQIDRAIQLLERRQARARIPELLIRRAELKRSLGDLSGGLADGTSAAVALSDSTPRGQFRGQWARPESLSALELLVGAADSPQAALDSLMRYSSPPLSSSNVVAIQRQLRERECLVAYFVGTHRVFAWTVRATSVELFHLGGVTPHLRAIADLRDAIEKDDLPRSEASARRVVEKAWLPLSRTLVSCDQTVVIPHGPLFLIPTIVFTGVLGGPKTVASVSPSFDFALRRTRYLPPRHLRLALGAEAPGLPILPYVREAPTLAWHSNLDAREVTFDSLQAQPSPSIGNDILLVAAHSRIWPRRPDLSGVFLGRKLRSAVEISQTHLGGFAWALVLVCESAKTLTPRSSESLLQAFLRAGARSAVGPIGSVRDERAARIGSRLVLALQDNLDPRHAVQSLQRSSSGDITLLDLAVFSSFSDREESQNANDSNGHDRFGGRPLA